MNRKEKEKGWEREQQIKLEEQKGNKIILNKWKCVVCGKEIPPGESFFDNGVYCKECWNKKKQSLPWSQPSE